MTPNRNGAGIAGTIRDQSLDSGTVVFSSAVFLFAFLPVALGAYHLSPRRFRNAVLLALSLVFYLWGGGAFVLWLLGSAVVDYVIARQILATAGDTRRRWVTVSVVGNVALLVAFKYAGLGVEVLNSLRGAFGDGSWPVPTVLLPLAISFFTFQRMSFTFDVAAGKIDPLPSFADYLLFGLLFPSPHRRAHRSLPRYRR